jgi:hypothetical protein
MSLALVLPTSTDIHFHFLSQFGHKKTPFRVCLQVIGLWGFWLQYDRREFISGIYVNHQAPAFAHRSLATCGSRMAGIILDVASTIYNDSRANRRNSRRRIRQVQDARDIHGSVPIPLNLGQFAQQHIPVIPKSCCLLIGNSNRLAFVIRSNSSSQFKGKRLNIRVSETYATSSH